MKVLIIGSGGREHALSWKIAQSPLVKEVLVAPGNPGTELEEKTRNIDINSEDIDGLVNFASENRIDMTIVGPETPLVLGIVDAFEKVGLRCFGPSQAAAQLEGSKAFMKSFLVRHNIPTANAQSFTTVTPALAFIESLGAPIVIKTDGLAAGKGVIIAQSVEEAKDTALKMLSGESFGEAGKRIVIEEFLSGEEVSFIAMIDGKHILPLASSQDHKARDDGDLGPNTGGMGAYSPTPLVDPMMHQRIMDEVMRPTVNGMQKDGHKYVGFLYAGLMIDADGNPRVLEFNCRFGDPETQPIMMRLQSDFYQLCQAALDGTLNTHTAQWDHRVALGVVMAADGYPESYDKGFTISGIDAAEQNGSKVFHAGTAKVDGHIETNGGRVLCVTALGDSVSQAQKNAYSAVSEISWQKAFYRNDIGYRAIQRENNS